MEEIRKAAKAVYENLSEEAKKRRKDKFRSMGKDGDGEISLQEFMTLFDDINVKRQGNRMFKLADQNGDGTIQFDEFSTLLYMFQSGRPLCDGCGDFIGGLFFTCTTCCLGRNGDSKLTYDLCIPCYHGRLFRHDHTEFGDNYLLLSKMRHMLSSGSEANPPLSHSSYYSSTSSGMTANPHLSFSSYSSTSSEMTANPHLSLLSYPAISSGMTGGLEEVLNFTENFASGLYVTEVLSQLF